VIVIDGADNEKPIYGFALLAGCAAIAAFFSLLIKEDLRRLDFSRTNSEVSMDAY
jgi:hypothetical protein